MANSLRALIVPAGRWLLIAAVAAAGTLAGPASAVTTTAARLPVERPPATEQPLPAGTQPNTLVSVAALSARYAWAVGERATELWDGQRWRSIANPLIHIGARLNGVAVTSTSNAWAVGSTSGGTALIIRWNGAKWTEVAVPIGRASLLGVAASSASNAWAVGVTVGGFSVKAKSVTLHWNGTKWRRVPSPNPRGFGLLTSVSIVPGTGAWAVGNGGQGPLIERWTGAKWVVTPSHGLARSLLNSVSAVSSTDAWIVGTIGQDALAVHWNGKSWKQVSTPSSKFAGLESVSAESPNDAWAVGETDGFALLLLRWNGNSWTRVKDPALPLARRSHALDGVAAVSAADAWAVGFYGGDRALLIRWNGTAWKHVQG